MSHPALAVLAAVFAWWFSTGAILWAVVRADRAGDGAHRRAVIAGLPLLLVGLAGAWASGRTAGLGAAYAGFASALAVWGWIELAFLTGLVTGPSRAPACPGARGLSRLGNAVATILWHEILLLCGLAALWLAARGPGSDVAVLTYAVLWAARVSAKLNLFLGAPRINEEFLPRPLSHLPSHFRRGPVSGLFPLALLGLTAAVLFWTERALVTGDVGFTLLAALTGLALLEHALMVVPLPDAKLWRWLMPAPKPALPDGGTEDGF